MERRLAAHGRDADAVAVAADAAHDAVDEVLHARRIQLAEAQRIEAGDRTRAHREDVAQDAADASGRALSNGGAVLLPGPGRVGEPAPRRRQAAAVRWQATAIQGGSKLPHSGLIAAGAGRPCGARR